MWPRHVSERGPGTDKAMIESPGTRGPRGPRPDQAIGDRGLLAPANPVTSQPPASRQQYHGIGPAYRMTLGYHGRIGWSIAAASSTWL